MNENISNIRIINSFKGLRIEIRADEDMEKEWETFVPLSFFKTSQKSDIPDGLFDNEEYGSDSSTLYFNNFGQANNLICSVVLINEEFDNKKLSDFWKMIFKYAFNYKLYAKVILKNNVEGKQILYKIFISGDESTGLLDNI